MTYKHKWELLPEVPREFVKKNPGYSRLILQLLYNRGITEKESIKTFLHPDKNNDYDPFLLKDMEKATELIIKHVKEKNKIYIYGDYDADGITASSLLYDLFSIFNADVGVYMPDRVKEGYGLNKGAIDEIIDDEASLIITVDTGIKNKEEVEYAKKKGVDVVITDHHVPPKNKKDLPKCLIIDPTLNREDYPFKNLAGVGVAFKLAEALITKSTLKQRQKKMLKDSLLDLVAIGTVADCVDLTGENRILVKEGLKILNHTKRIGLQELIKKSNLNKRIEAWNIGFQIAPRINASGRVDHAAKAFYLLISNNKREASERAGDLNEKNNFRQRSTEEVFSQVMQQVDTSDGVLVAVSPKKKPWAEGVIGLVAGKVMNQYYRPALVLTYSENKFKGSGRGVEEFNIVKAVEKCGDLLTNFGGHPAACGFSLPEENLDKFLKKIKEISNKEIDTEKLLPTIKIDYEIDINKVDEELYKEVQKLEPFGEGNPRPVFMSRNVDLRDIVRMGKNKEHMKFRFNNVWGVSFGQNDKWEDLKIGDKVDVVYYVDINEFNGSRNVQLKVIDIK